MFNLVVVNGNNRAIVMVVAVVVVDNIRRSQCCDNVVVVVGILPYSSSLSYYEVFRCNVDRYDDSGSFIAVNSNVDCETVLLVLVNLRHDDLIV